MSNFFSKKMQNNIIIKNSNKHINKNKTLIHKITKFSNFLLLTIAIILLSSCTDPRINDIQSTIKDMNKEIELIDNKVDFSLEAINEILEYDNLHNILDRNNRVKLEEIGSWLRDVSDCSTSSLYLRIEELESILNIY